MGPIYRTHCISQSAATIGVLKSYLLCLTKHRKRILQKGASKFHAVWGAVDGKNWESMLMAVDASI